jgi:hypothetical protein
MTIRAPDGAGGATMRAERPGDRGRQFRVWDYVRKAQYAGMNSEHGCGGA